MLKNTAATKRYEIQTCGENQFATIVSSKTPQKYLSRSINLYRQAEKIVCLEFILVVLKILCNPIMSSRGLVLLLWNSIANGIKSIAKICV